MKPEFPLVWDNSMRSELVSCPRKFAWKYLDLWSSQHESIDLTAGKAFAAGLEVARRSFYLEGLSTADSEARGLQRLIGEYGNAICPPDNPKSLNRLAEAFAYYFTVFPMDRDPAQPYRGATGPMIEFSFALPLHPSLVHPVTGEPIIFAGRADMVATYAGAVSIYDDKTTKSLGATWGQNWDMRAQFTGYTWAALEYGIPVTQVLVRGISILKTKLDHAQHISARSAYRIKRWHGQIVRDIRRAISMWEEGYWDYNESDACTSYSGCQFRQPCQHELADPYLETYFVKKKWDPVKREEIVLNPSALVPAGEEWQLVGNVNDFIKRK